MGRIRVVLADDHKAMLDRVVKLLEFECDVVGTATDGPQALETTRNSRPDVLVLDISMPTMNGFEVAQQLRADSAGPRVVFLTIHEDQEFVREAFKAGAFGYVAKPRIGSDLLLAVKEAHAGRLFVSPPVSP